MKTNFPIKRNFSQDFLTKNGKNIFTIEYEQASLREYYEFLEKTDTQKHRELFKIIERSINPTLKDKVLLRIGR